MNYKECFEQWKKALMYTPYKDELKAIPAGELEDSFYRYLSFGTAGMRGILGLGTNRMNVFTVRRSTQGLADWLHASKTAQGGVAIAYDSRHMSREFALETALVLAKNGIHAYLYESLRSVPQLSFTINELGTAAGVVITASHNAPKYNGYKVYGADGGQLAPSDADVLTEYIDRVGDYLYISPMDECEAIDKGLLTRLGAAMDERFYSYEGSLLTDPQIIREQGERLKIVYTPLHGSGNLPVRRLLAEAGLKNVYVVPEQEKPDGAFPTLSAPNPEDPRAFELAIKLANEKQANMIIATDPDCDRMGVAVRGRDGEFTVLTGNQIGCLLMDYVLSARTDLRPEDFVVKSVVSTPMADRIAEHYGVRLRTVLTGFRYIAEQIKLSLESGAGRFLFGFEESYGFLAGTRVRDKDAALASLLISEAACRYLARGMTLADAVDALNEKYGWHMEKGLSVTREGQSGLESIAKTTQRLRSAPPASLGDIPVVRVADYKTGIARDLRTGETQKLTLPEANMIFLETECGRVILRPSGTEPKLKAYCCAVSADREQAQKILDIFAAQTQKLLADD